MKYRLKKDLPTFKAGAILEISSKGNLVYRGSRYGGLKVIDKYMLGKNPGILESEWFEPFDDHSNIVDFEIGKTFFSIDIDGSIGGYRWDNSDWCRDIRDWGNAYHNEEEAKEESVRRKAKRVLLEDTRGFKPDIFDNDQGRYYVAYDPSSSKLCSVRESFDVYSHEILFESYEDAEESIRVHEQEWKIYLRIEDKEF